MLLGPQRDRAVALQRRRRRPHIGGSSSTGGVSRSSLACSPPCRCRGGAPRASAPLAGQGRLWSCLQQDVCLWAGEGRAGVPHPASPPSSLMRLRSPSKCLPGDGLRLRLSSSRRDMAALANGCERPEQGSVPAGRALLAGSSQRAVSRAHGASAGRRGAGPPVQRQMLTPMPGSPCTPVVSRAG